MVAGSEGAPQAGENPEGAGKGAPGPSLLQVPLSPPGLFDLGAPDLDLPLAVAEKDGGAK